MTKAADRIIQGLREAAAHARGGTVPGLKVHIPNKVDVDWIKRGGQDVMTLVKEAGKRITSLHLRSAQNGVWMEEFGDGDVDYREVAAYLKKQKWSGLMLVELAYEKGTKPTRGLEENLRRSREYAEKIFA